MIFKHNWKNSIEAKERNNIFYERIHNNNITTTTNNKCGTQKKTETKKRFKNSLLPFVFLELFIEYICVVCLLNRVEYKKNVFNYLWNSQTKCQKRKIATLITTTTTVPTLQADTFPYGSRLMISFCLFVSWLAVQ